MYLPKIILCFFALFIGRLAAAQSIAKLEARAINRTHIRVVSGDSVEVFSITTRQPGAKQRGLYYWYAQNQINRSVGAYQGKLLHGPYQLLDRGQHLLVSGQFEKGRKTGRWQTYRPDGSLATSSEWGNGAQRGKTVQYAADGKPQRPLPASNAAPADTSGSRWQKLRLIRRKGRQAAVPATGTKVPGQKKADKKKRPAAPAAGASSPAPGH